MDKRSSTVTRTGSFQRNFCSGIGLVAVAFSTIGACPLSSLKDLKWFSENAGSSPYLQAAAPAASEALWTYQMANQVPDRGLSDLLCQSSQASENSAWSVYQAAHHFINASNDEEAWLARNQVMEAEWQARVQAQQSMKLRHYAYDRMLAVYRNLRQDRDAFQSTTTSLNSCNAVPENPVLQLTRKLAPILDRVEPPSEENEDPEPVPFSVDSPIRQAQTSKQCHSNPSLNFGVLVFNDYYKIYRSTGMGEEGLKAYKKHLWDHGLPCPTRIIYMNHYGYKLGFMDKVKNLVAPKSYFRGLFAAQQEKVANLFSRKNPQDVYQAGCRLDPRVSPEEEEEEVEFEREEELDPEKSQFFPFEFIHPKSHNVYLSGAGNPFKGVKEAKVPGADGPRKGGREAFYEVIKNLLVNDGPVNFHCMGGIHRTGMTGLMVRYLQGGDWTEPFNNPIEKPATRGVWLGARKKKIKAVLNNMAEMEYYNHNNKNFRKENLEAVEALSKDRRFQCIKNAFSCYLSAPAVGEAKKCYTAVKRFANEREAKACGTMLSAQKFDITQKEKLWQKCEKSFGFETEISSQLDELEGLVSKGRSQKEKQNAARAIAADLSKTFSQWRKSSSSQDREIREQLQKRFYDVLSDSLNSKK